MTRTLTTSQRELDEERTARLLFAVELAEGAITAGDLRHPAVRAAAAAWPVPAWPVRTLERVAMKAGRLSWESRCLGRVGAAHASVLGDAPRALRVLVRVDEFPHARVVDEPSRYGASAFLRFHDILRGAGVPYLLAVSPRVSRRYLDPRATGGRRLDDGERAVLAGLTSDDGVELAMHGYDHRTRRRSPRRRSELAGLSPDALRAYLDRSEAELADAGVHARVFVPPFNRFDRRQYPVLAERFDVVTGGPENVRSLGLQCSPRWWGEAVYLPAYHPLYGRAAEVLPALRALRDRGAAGWVPVVLHWGWEADAGWRDLEALAAELRDVACPWDAFLAAVEASR